jgi:hypothetical protein
MTDVSTMKIPLTTHSDIMSSEHCFIKLNGAILDFERDIEEVRYFLPP